MLAFRNGTQHNYLLAGGGQSDIADRTSNTFGSELKCDYERHNDNPASVYKIGSDADSFVNSQLDMGAAKCDRVYPVYNRTRDETMQHHVELDFCKSIQHGFGHLPDKRYGLDGATEQF